LSVRFWGVRGSIASPGPDTLKYGGNTSCVEMRCGGNLLIFDAGTGLRALGLSLAAEAKPVDAELFCSHTHFDHICGFPFFAPCYAPGSKIRVWAGHLNGRDIRDVFHTAMSDPLFPNVMGELARGIEFRNFTCGETLAPRPGIAIKTAPLNHPGGATGYRVEWNGKTVAYVTDTEHPAGGFDQSVLGLVSGADIMVYDANYTEDDYGPHEGWGHSTWQAAVRVAERAGARTLVLFHHDPARTDAMLDAIAAEAGRARPGTLVAREGLTLVA
jgi:phosphoribosyl 1,2-cyclic phosphodiesterase